MSTRKIDDDVRSSYPYPLAATFHRAFYDTRDVALIHDYLLDLFEITLKYLSSCALAQFIQDGSFDAKLSASLVNLQTPTLENWQTWLVDTVRVYHEQNRALQLSEIADFLEYHNSGQILAAFVHVRDLMAERMEYSDYAGDYTAVKIREFFDLLAQYRGRAALAAKLSIYERREIVEALLPAMRELFVAMDFIARYRLVYINEVKLVAGSRRDTRYEHFVTDLTGYGPSVINEPFVLPKPSARPGELYVCAKDEDFAPLFSLHPFLIYHYCRECSADQTFALRLNRDNNLVYYSSQCSHQFGLTDYLDDIRVVIGALSNAGPAGATLAAPLKPALIASAANAASQAPLALSPDQQKIQAEIEEQQKQLQEERRKLEEERERIAHEFAQLNNVAQQTPASAAPQHLICPNCGAENQSGKRFCTTCGKPLAMPKNQPAVPLVPAATTLPATSPPAQPQAYHWPSGADPLPWEQPPASAAPLAAPVPATGPEAAFVAAPSRICPRCGQQNNTKTKFCTQCGLPLPPI